MSDLATLVPCMTTGLTRAQGDACARDFVKSFGKRAFRGRLTGIEMRRAAPGDSLHRAEADTVKSLKERG